MCDLYENILDLINELSQSCLQGVFEYFEEIKHFIKSIRNNVTLSSIHPSLYLRTPADRISLIIIILKYCEG